MNEIERAIEFLQSLGKEMKEQDNDYQAAPRFWVVAENKKEYGIDTDYADGIVAYNSEGSTWETPEELMQHLIEYGYIEEEDVDKRGKYDFAEIIDMVDGSEYGMCGYKENRDVISPNTFFLTKRECKDHIERYSNHYAEPHPYAMTAWRSPQVERLYDIIKNTEWETVLAALREQADFVRCKYCEYWQDNNGGYPNEECRWGHDETPDADDFCSFGKRLEVEP
jgi:hypothetical protein